MKKTLLLLIALFTINIVVSQNVNRYGTEYPNATEETDFSTYSRVPLMNENGLLNAFIHSDSIALKSDLNALNLSDNGDGTYTFNDGSGTPFTIDNNVDLSDYVTQQNLTDYLPLTGGELTGKLESTSGIESDTYIYGANSVSTNGEFRAQGNEILFTESNNAGSTQLFANIEGSSRIYLPSTDHLQWSRDTLALSSDLPTNLSDLVNDSEYITINDIPISESTSKNAGIGFTDFETDDTGEKLQVNGLIRSNVDVYEITDDKHNATKEYVDLVVDTRINDSDITDNQTLSFNDNILSISNGNQVGFNNFMTLDAYQIVSGYKVYENDVAFDSRLNLHPQSGNAGPTEGLMLYCNIDNNLQIAPVQSNARRNAIIDLSLLQSGTSPLSYKLQDKSGTVAHLDDIGINIYDSDGVLQGTTSSLTLSEDLEYNDATNTISLKDEVISLESSLVNGWTNYDYRWENVSYTKKGNTVTLYGMLSSGTSGTILNLPTELIPNKSLIADCRDSSNDTHTITLSSSGTLTISGTYSTAIWLSLKSITYNINN